ncbi:MAG: hypothetical protein Q8L14_21920 [Myxococcales bacterium]|nr:hypothetical protein [Myxococcales bacterium]
MTFKLPLKLRRELWAAGFGGIDSALRFAAVELDLFMMCTGFDYERDGDDGERHFANYLAWSDTALGGVHRAVTSAGNQALIAEWGAVSQHPVRAAMRDARNQALKGRTSVVSREVIVDLGDSGRLVGRRLTTLPGAVLGEYPVFGTAADYLLWIRDDALPLLRRAVGLGATKQDARGLEDMTFPNEDPWSPRASFEIERLLE